ncbi:hypothetical protein Rumeso_02540 [Rubellimicrobium mesophilum DSM 19309]|uniref:ABM domain-containing protein n=1 Tax=Rubellimicrobium mesophilum DSM 19309 TaxID=442562 RepID=A0A017HN61_9RHOB|nr:antibiotic biosynthesis monooxygenase [Rubellimicrobium mesophilum]EYD75922.1 hypothetical protein Rumeso_02540 [Rubellimicrobium mesophilum DSM 19309]
MEACNVIRMRVKPEYEEEFLRINDNPGHDVEHGLRTSLLVRTGERTYCFVGQWDSLEALATSGPVVVRELDRVSHMLEDLGDGKGCLEPISGEVVARRRYPELPGEYWSG